MSAVLKWTKLLWATVLLGCMANAAAQAQAPAAGRPTAVKALLIGLTDDKNIGAGVEADLKLVEGYLRGLPGFNAERDLRKATGAQVTPANIEQAIQELQCGPNDVLFCYYAGHGAYDPSLAEGDPSGGHFFQIPGGDLRRASLLNWLENKGARLTVLFSDACNVAATFQPAADEESGSESAPKETPTATPVVSRAFEMLLFDYTGVVDVNGASRDQYGLAGGGGTVSTFGLLLALQEKDESPRFWKNPFLAIGELPLNWERFLNDASEDTDAIFHEVKKTVLAQPEPDDEGAKEQLQLLKDQEDQRPQTFRLDVRTVGQAEEPKGDVRPSPFAPEDWLKSILDAKTGPHN